MKILFCGGGTLGPVTPLLAVLRRMRHLNPTATFAWAGTSSGPEAGLVEAEGIPFHAVPVARLPRYISLEWLKFPLKYLEATRITRSIVAHEQPDLVVTAGGYTGVPIIRYAASIGIPCAMHQLDVEPGLSNRAVAARCAAVTTSFRYDSRPFGFRVDAHQIETPCRFAPDSLPSSEEARRFFGIDPSRPVVFVLGGGTGALAINQAIADVLDELLIDADVIHSTGIGKSITRVERQGYHVFEQMDETHIRHAYVAANIVVSRAGLGTLSELASLSKASIVVPMPGSHQEANARAIEQGVVWLHQSKSGFPDALRDTVTDLLGNVSRQKSLGFQLHQLLPTDNGTSLATRWLKLL